MNELIAKVEQWAKDRGLNQADPKAQFLKVSEEVGEIASSYNFANNLADELLAFNIQHNENQLIGIIYSQLLDEFTFNYSGKDLWMIAENISEKIASQQPKLNDDQKNELKKLKNRFAWFGNSASHALFDYMTDNDESCLNNKEFAGILSDFAVWVLEQEEDAE